MQRILSLSGVVFLACLWAVMATNAHAVVSLGALAYSENFNTLPVVSVPAVFPFVGAIQAPIPGPTGWDGVKLSGTGVTNMNFNADDGNNNAGALYSYGSAGSSERALGSLASGSNVPAFGVELVNNTGQSLSSVTISYVGEFWRSSTTTQNVLSFAYGMSGGPITSANYLSSAAMTSEPALSLTGPVPVMANGALDGNLPANQVIVGPTMIAFNPLAPGQSLFLRWQDADNVGNDAGLAIDDFMLTATPVPEPATVSILILGAACLLRRKR